jgi:hypothetical protein
MLACPNYASVPRLLKGSEWGIWCLDSHLWQFTRRQILVMLKKTGFTPISARTLHGYDPDSKLKKRLLDLAALLNFGDGLNAISIKK